MVRTDTVEGMSFNNGGSDKANKRTSNADEQKNHETAFTLVQWGKLTREEEPYTIVAYTGDRSVGFLSQNNEPEPKGEGG